MRHPALVMLAIGLIIFTGCGKQKMTQAEAVETLQMVPLTSNNSEDASIDNLRGMIQNLVDSGQVQVASSARGAFKLGAVNLDMLNQVLALLQQQSGQKFNLMQLVTQLLAMNGNNTTTTGTKLDAILALINQIAPIIATIAPQFAPILAAISTFLPMVVGLINMFKKPKPSPAPSAMLMSLAPVRV